MKNLLLLTYFLLSLSSFAQKGVNPITLIKNHVIKETKNTLELPKYFKLEKIDVTLTRKSETIAYQIGVNEVFISDSNFKPKYLVSEDDDYTDFKKSIVYKIDSLKKVSEGYTFYLHDKKKEVLEFYYTSMDVNIRCYKSVKTEKITMDSYYDTKIIYWAMSNGGTLRLYKDLGFVSMDKKNKIEYTILPEDN